MEKKQKNFNLFCIMEAIKLSCKGKTGVGTIFVKIDLRLKSTPV